MNASAPPPVAGLDPATLSHSLRRWGEELGFTGLGVANIDLSADEAHFLDWLRAGSTARCGYMSRHGSKRTRPAELLPGTVSCISARMDYWPAEAADAQAALADGSARLRIALCARPRLPQAHAHRLQKLCDRIQRDGRPFRPSGVYRQRAGFGEGPGAQRRPGLDRQAHEFDRPQRRIRISFSARSTSTWRCRRQPSSARIAAPAAPACRPAPPVRSSRPIGSTPGAAFPISPSSSRAPFRSSFAAPSAIASMDAMIASWYVPGTNLHAPPRRRISRCATDSITRSSPHLFSWSEAEFLEKTRGSAIRRIGYERWLRNIAVALGNAPSSHDLIAALTPRERAIASPLVREHVQWALAQHPRLPIALNAAGSRAAAGGIEEMPAAPRLG